MKRTLLLSPVLGILPTSYATLAADDLFVPQSILNIAKDTTATEKTTVSAENYSTCYTDSEAQTIRDVLEQNQQFTEAYSKRSAIVKDGLGTLVVGSTTEPLPTDPGSR